MALWKALASGLVGAVTVTAIHQVAKHTVDDAPRMDLLGMRAIAKGMRAADQTPPDRDTLFNAAMVGDLIANSLYYSLVGLGGPGSAPLRGTAIGAAAGVGGVALPGPLGLGADASARTPETQAMTVAWYTLGGLAAGLARKALG